MLERRIAERAAALELAVEEPTDVVPRCVRDGTRVGLKRLHDHATRRVAPAAAGELGQQLKGALLGPEVGQAETQVGIDDRRQLDAGEVMPFRDHLRADEHRPLGLREALEGLP